MLETVDKISILINKHLKDELSEVERQELDIWLAEDEKNRELLEQMNNKEILVQRLVEFSSANKEAVWQKTVSRINTEGDVIRMVPIIPALVKKAIWVKIATATAAAAVVLTGGIWLYKAQKNKPKEVVHTPVTPKQLNDKVVPGYYRAILTLADNSTVTLDKENKEVAREGNINITSKNGELFYKQLGAGTVEQANLNNIVTTPKGGMYRVVLPDGSKVWLNAASSLRFPIVFAGNERRIQLTGEAYFEVAHLSSGSQNMPFKVEIRKSGKVSGLVEVFGTHFNIMAYEDETTVQATLLEGSVKVTGSNGNEQKGKFLKPGFQAQLINDRIETSKVDADRAVWWKDGYFPAENLQTVVRQIARWYDLTVVNESNIPDKPLAGKVSRNVAMESLIKVLKDLGLETKLEGRNLIIQ